MSVLSYEAIMSEHPIGATRLIELPAPGMGNRIFAKAEHENPTGSHYDRVYWNLLQSMEDAGKIHPNITTLVETTSGNSGISCAWLAKLRGYQGCALFTPEKFRPRCIELMAAQGAEVRESTGGNGIMDAARDMRTYLISRVMEKVGELRKFVSPNHSQVLASCDALAPIAEEATAEAGELFDCFVGAAGNGCTLWGIGSRLREGNPNMHIMAFESSRARVAQEILTMRASQQPHQLHTLFGTGGWGVDFPHLKRAVTELVDNVVPVDEGSWVRAQRELADMGHAVGNTSAASYQLACDYCEGVTDKNVLIVFYDSADHY